MDDRKPSSLNPDAFKTESLIEGPFWPQRVRVISTRQIGSGLEIRGRRIGYVKCLLKRMICSCLWQIGFAGR